MGKYSVKRHFVQFYSPGTFMSEVTEKPIDSWDVEEAQQMAHGIVERHGATPFAFRFVTRGRTAKDLNSKVLKRSQSYYLGGKIETRGEVEKRNDPEEKILRSNMRSNGYGRIIVNTNSWKVTQPFEDGDILLDWTP